VANADRAVAPPGAPNDGRPHADDPVRFPQQPEPIAAWCSRGASLRRRIGTSAPASRPADEPFPASNGIRSSRGSWVLPTRFSGRVPFAIRHSQSAIDSS